MKRISLILSALMTSLVMGAQVNTISDTTNIVYVTYDGSSATVDISTNIASFVSASLSGSSVSIVQTNTAADSATCGEIEYILAGSSSDGSFYMEGSYKARVSLYGLTLTNSSGPAINIQNGKRIDISIKRNTENTLADGTSTATDAWKGTLQCKGHVEFKGHGTLNVYGNYANALWSKEYMEVKNCTIHVLSAAKDAINCNQYFLMESGVVTLSGFADDGISVGLKNNDTSTENTGNFTMTGGELYIDMSAASGKAVNQAAGTYSVSDAAILNTNWHEAIDTTSSPDGQSRTQLILRDGQFFILRDNKTYNLQGTIID